MAFGGKRDVGSRSVPTTSDVSHAFGLGWDMTYLYTYVGDKGSELPDLEDRLPSLSRLSEQKRSLIRLDRIRGPIAHLKDQFREVDVGDLKPSVDRIEKKLTSGKDVEEVKQLLCDLHYLLMRAFSTADNRLAKAYRLGRSLATTCHVANDQVGLTFAGDKSLLGKPGIFIAVEGKASLTKDRLAFEEHWVDDMERWFPQGIETPGIVLLRVHASRVHYWDGEEEGEVEI